MECKHVVCGKVAEDGVAGLVIPRLIMRILAMTEMVKWKRGWVLGSL